MSHVDDGLPQLEQLQLENEDTEPESFADILPWEDIIFRCIFPCLDQKSLFQVRAVSTLYHDCVSEYFKKLKKLVLCNNPKFTAQTFHLITAENSTLKLLVIRNSSSWITDDNIVPVIECNSNLKHVDLSENTSLSDRAIQRLVISCGHSMRTLILRECAWLSSSIINQIAVNCPGLEKLDITGCWDVQDTAIVNLSRMCKRLKHLGVAKIYGLTDVSISEVAKNSRELTHLNIQGCWRVTDKAVFLLSEYCSSLRVLQARECRDITMAALTALSEKGVKVDPRPGQKKLTAAHAKIIKQMKLLPM